MTVRHPSMAAHLRGRSVRVKKPPRQKKSTAGVMKMEKDTLVPIEIFLGVAYLWRLLDAKNLSPKNKILYDAIDAYLTRKKNRLRNRQAYTDYKRSGPDKKPAALRDYLETKKITFRGRGR